MDLHLRREELSSAAQAHRLADFLAEIATNDQADPAMAARELSGALCEALELLAACPADGVLEISLRQRGDRLCADLAATADPETRGALEAARDALAAAPDLDALLQGASGHGGLAELALLHGVEVSIAVDADRALVALALPPQTLGMRP
ncbi:MAG: hypothetical protein H6739_09525 [Alphaproteobacteria bacterium]|nr:hypothetical protein [Alphaproteobacteria bacterium]